jgi:hypothetical protein
MFRMIYRSTQRVEFSPLDLKKLLAQARLRNRAARVSGMLIYKDGEFLQTLEGDEGAVKKIFNRIENDPRHGDFCILQPAEFARGPRMFSDWAMGFADATCSAFMLSGFIEAKIGSSLSALDKAGAMDILLATSRTLSSRSSLRSSA